MTGGEHKTLAALREPPLAALGEVIVPVEPRAKRCFRSRDPEDLFAPGDEDLRKYLRAGFNYGVVTRGDLAVLDADDPEQLAPVLDALPATASWVTGSREGEAYLFRVPGLDADIPLDDPETGENIGHIKAAPRSYAVAPGSVHPSENHYGPLEGEAITTVDEDDLREAIAPFIASPPESEESEESEERTDRSRGGGERREDPDADLSIYDVLSRESCPEGERVAHPFHDSDTGANFMVDEGGDTFRCWRHDVTGNALHLVGIEQEIIRCGEWDRDGGLDTEKWREIFAAAPDEVEGDRVAVLPELSNEWDWRRGAAGHAPTLTIQEARDRTQEAIEDAFEYSDRVLIEALPTTGKSRGTIAAAAATGEPITVLTGRGRKEQYEQFEQWCIEEGIEKDRIKVLPSFAKHCDTANGEHGHEWADRVDNWYSRGAMPQAIHKYAEDELGRPLPCQTYEEQECPYTARWRFDPDEYDVLIGHYSHAHKRKVTQGRTVVFDEFPGNAYETMLDDLLPGAVTRYLQRHDSVPFEDYTDLVEGRDDEQRRADALVALPDPEDLDPDETAPIEDAAGHAAAPLAVFTLLAGAKNDLGNGWERADLGDGRVGLHDREEGRVVLLTPPLLEHDETGRRVNGTVALDGTPTREMWKLALGVDRLNHLPVLSEAEREEYIRDVLGLQLVRTTEWVKPYNSPDHVHAREDAALLEAIADEHGEKPGLITTATARDEYERAGVLEFDDDRDLVDGLASAYRHYGNVLGSNEFTETRVGAVIGSNHYGDAYIEKWGAFAGEAVQRGAEKGQDLSYGAFGDRILTHMREHDTLQAAMRFGRDGNGAVVYVHTGTLPEWVPVAGVGRVVRTRSAGERQVLEAARTLDEWTTAGLADHPGVEIEQRQVFNVLDALAERGVLEREYEGKGYVWRPDGLHRVSEYGDVELDPVDLDEVGASTVQEISRSTTYTWNFLKTATELGCASGEAASSGVATGDISATGGEPPPHDTG